MSFLILFKLTFFAFSNHQIKFFHFTTKNPPTTPKTSSKTKFFWYNKD
ncbi:hypothetical protein M33023_01430 [Candidatus Phytoplasma asteris]|uniref:Uncharacterized protein n=1 Tax=Candidatus Phytoplasma asteris TaxID=85620 RepID=A0ABZ2YEP0_9MOLU